MKKHILTLVLACCLLPAFPADAEAEPSRGDLRYEQIIAPRYEEAERFSEGYAAVKQNGKWGYIDTDGRTVLPFRYEKAYDFSEGYAVVSPNVVERNVYELANGSVIEYNYYDLGCVDLDGNYTQFFYTDPVSGEVSPVVVPDIFLPSELVFHNGFVRVTIPGIGGQLFDASGHSLLLSGDLDHVTGPLNEGLAPAEGRMEGLVGWVDAEGEVVQKFYIQSGPDANTQTFVSAVLPFHGGLAPVWQCATDWNTGESTYLLGFMDRSFRWVIAPQYTNYWRSDAYTDYAVFGETGLAMVAKNGRYGAIDRTGKTVIPFRYEILGQSSDGMILFREGGKYGYLDAETNELAIEPQYMKATMFRGGLAAVWDGRSTYLIDRAGNSYADVVTLDRSAYFQQNEDSSEIALSPDEYVVVRENGLCGYGHLSYTPPAPVAGALDDWALEEVREAAAACLIPQDLQCLYRQEITRAEFCTLAVTAVERITGQDASSLVRARTGKSLIDWRRTYPFHDAASEEIIAAYALGIVSGRGEGAFDPYSGITRQEAAVMLQNAAKAAGRETALQSELSVFSDGYRIADWARDAVTYVVGTGVMLGTGPDVFSPLSPYTREQSYLTVLRLYRCLRS